MFARGRSTGICRGEQFLRLSVQNDNCRLRACSSNRFLSFITSSEYLADGWDGGRAEEEQKPLYNPARSCWNILRDQGSQTISGMTASRMCWSSTNRNSSGLTSSSSARLNG